MAHLYIASNVKLRQGVPPAPPSRGFRFRGFPMAIYSFNAGIVKRSSGQFVTAAAAYRAGEKIHDETSGLTHDYTNKRDVDAKEILLPDGAPEWMHDRARLWTTIERVERRRDAQLARKLMMALPVELSPAENRQLVQQFLQQTCVSKGMVADVCYHGLDSHNPHAHVLLTLRTVSSEGFGGKERSWNDKAMLQGWREQWQEHTNAMLQLKGFQERIDHRTLQEQGIERIPQIHLGPNVAAMRDKGIATERGDLYAEIEDDNEHMSHLVQERDALDAEIAFLEALYEQGVDIADDATVEAYRDAQTADRAGQRPQATAAPVRPVTTEESEEGDSSTSAAAGEDAAAGSTDTGGVAAGGGSPVKEDFRVDGATPYPGLQEEDNAIRLSPSTDDATTLAIHEQLQAIGADRYEVMLTRRRANDGRLDRQHRRWDGAEITRSVSWLKRMNAQGWDVMLRPEKNQGFVILDQLNKRQVDRMRADGLSPALVLNTHQSRYQAWVRLDDAAIPHGEALAAAQIMAQTYHCNAHSWQYGRLAGFTNQRTWRPEGEQAPYVRFIDAEPDIPVSAPQLREEAQQRAHRNKSVTRQQDVVGGLTKGLDRRLVDIEKPFKSERDAAEYEFMYWYHRYFDRFGKPRDTSRTDWKMCHILAMRGFSANAIRGAMRRQSPNEFQKQLGTFDQYVNSMVYRVMRRPEVVARREELMQERQQGRAKEREKEPEIER
jgi:hypothetical protein